MSVDSRRIRRRLRGRGTSLTPFLLFFGGSALVVAVGGFVLSSRLPELPHSRAVTHAQDVRTYAQVLAGIWIAVTALAIVLWFSFARRNVRSSELVLTARELEQSLLDTIETLNAAVEARDPYTAGHSQRVRRVALAIGRALQLPEAQ